MNTLKDPQVTTILTDLHQKAAIDSTERQEQKKQANVSSIAFDHAWATAYLAVGPEEGRLLYFLATMAGAKTIVEFGCSFGISTIYLAAAAKDNGGRLITTDLEPNKAKGARKNLEAAGLSELVEIRQGDAKQTLADIEGYVDFLFLDGAKELYLPIFELLHPQLNKSAIIFADNADKIETRPLTDLLKNSPKAFSTLELFEGRAFIARVI